MTVENCDNCGVCCLGQNLLPFSGNLVDARKLPEDLMIELLRIAKGPLFGDDGCACVWLDRATGRCRHYEHRPSVCREGMQPGDENCLLLREAAGLST